MRCEGVAGMVRFRMVLVPHLELVFIGQFQAFEKPWGNQRVRDFASRGPLQVSAPSFPEGWGNEDLVYQGTMGIFNGKLL